MKLHISDGIKRVLGTENDQMSQKKSNNDDPNSLRTTIMSNRDVSKGSGTEEENEESPLD